MKAVSLKDVEDQTFKESAPTQSKKTKSYLSHQQNQIKEEGNGYDHKYGLNNRMDFVPQSCIYKLRVMLQTQTILQKHFTNY